MTHKLISIIGFLSILALVFTLVGGAGIAIAMPVCDPTFVTMTGAEILVKPGGVDDTANLQCAFDAAVAAGPGAIVRLGSGTFHTAQIVVEGFQGQFTGAGVEQTSVYNLPDLYVTPVDMYLDLPSASNPWPVLFAFINGDYSISNLAIYIVGDHPTQEWTIFGIEPPLKELSSAILIVGTEAHVRVDHILVEGKPLAGSLFGYNLGQAFYFEGFIGYPPPPISGSFSVYHSTFRHMASGTPLVNIANAVVVVSHNTYEDTFLGMDGADFINSSLEFSNNDVYSTIGFNLYPNFSLEDVGSTFLIQNNRFHGSTGIALEQNYGEGNQCLVLGNNVQQVAGIGVFLGEGVRGCTVVGNNQTNVVDLGTDNTLVGVNNMGAGIGPSIQTIYRKIRR